MVKIENERWWDVIIFDFFDDAMPIGFFELFLQRVRNGNFSCSSKPPNKAHPPKQALRPARLFKINVIKLFLGVSFDQGHDDWHGDASLTAPPRPRTACNDFFFFFFFLFFLKNEDSDVL